MNMADIEYLLTKLANASILAHPEVVSLEAACRIVAALRQNLHYQPERLTPDEVVLLIQQLPKGQ